MSDDNHELFLDYYRYSCIYKCLDYINNLDMDETINRRIIKELNRFLMLHAGFVNQLVVPKSPDRLTNKFLTISDIPENCCSNCDVMIPLTDSPYFVVLRNKLLELKVANPDKIIEILQKFFNNYHNLSNNLILSNSITMKNVILTNELLEIGDHKLKLNESVVNWLKSKYIGPDEKMEYYLTRIFLRYSALDMDSGNQYALPPEITKRYSLELFASPFNFSLPNYASIFPDIDKFFSVDNTCERKGSIGKYPECLEQTFDSITANPPFIDLIQNDLVKRMLKLLDKYTSDNRFIRILITIANWYDSWAFQKLLESKYMMQVFRLKYYCNVINNKHINMQHSATFLLQTKPAWKTIPKLPSYDEKMITVKIPIRCTNVSYSDKILVGSLDGRPVKIKQLNRQNFKK